MAKMLLSGQGARNYMLTTKNQLQADQLNGRMFLIIRGSQGLVLSYGIVQADFNALQQSLDDHLMDLGVGRYDILSLTDQGAGILILIFLVFLVFVKHCNFSRCTCNSNKHLLNYSSLDFHPQRLTWPSEGLRISSEKIPTVSYLLDLQLESMAKPVLVEQLAYAAVNAVEQYLPVRSSLEITMIIDVFMSNLMRVYHPTRSDSTVLGN